MWWLGEPAALTFALANLDLMIVRPCLEADREPIVVGMLEAAERKALEERIRAQPGHFVAQYPVTPSLSPKWDGNDLVPAAMVMRVFVSAEGDAYRVLPGGLAREPMGDTCLRSLGRLNGTLKDVWVLAEDAADVQLPSTRRFHQVAVERGGADLQSRVADNLFWLGRYIERLDNDARLLRTTATKVATGAVSPRDAIELRLLGRLLSQANLMDQASALSAPENAAFQQGLAAVAADDRGLVTVLDAIQRLTSSMRERFSVDMITAAGPVMAEVRQRLTAARGNLDPLLAALDEIVQFVAILSGLAQENMTRGTGWRFLDLGRRLERAQFVATGALGPFAQSPIDWEAAMWVALELCDSTITYRTRYLGQLQPAPVLDLVILDDSNPRSLAFQLRAIEGHLDYLARVSGVRVPALPASLDHDLNAAVKQFAGDEQVWRHEGLALAMLRDLAERDRPPARRTLRGDHARLLLPRAGGAGRRLVDGVSEAMKYLLSHRTSYTYASTVNSAQHIAHLRARAFPGQKVSSISIETNPDPGAGGAAHRPFRQQHRHLPPRQAAQPLRHRGARRNRRALSRSAAGRLDAAVGRGAHRAERRRLSGLGRGERIRLRIAAGAGARGVEGLRRQVARRRAGRSSRRRASSPRASRRTSSTIPAPPTSARRSPRSSPARRASARTSPMSRSPPCAPTASQRPMSRATSAPSIPRKRSPARRRCQPRLGRGVVRRAAGWVHLDPTNDLVAKEDHVAVAWGRDFSDVSPLRGVILGGDSHSYGVAVTLVPTD